MPYLARHTVGWRNPNSDKWGKYSFYCSKKFRVREGFAVAWYRSSKLAPKTSSFRVALCLSQCHFPFVVRLAPFLVTTWLLVVHRVSHPRSVGGGRSVSFYVFFPNHKISLGLFLLSWCPGRWNCTAWVDKVDPSSGAELKAILPTVLWCLLGVGHNGFTGGSTTQTYIFQKLFGFKIIFYMKNMLVNFKVIFKAITTFCMKKKKMLRIWKTIYKILSLATKMEK